MEQRRGGKEGERNAEMKRVLKLAIKQLKNVAAIFDIASINVFFGFRYLHQILLLGSMFADCADGAT